MSGPTRTVHLEATQHCTGLCVHRVHLKSHISFSGKSFCYLVIVLTPDYAEHNSFTSNASIITFLMSMLVFVKRL